MRYKVVITKDGEKYASWEDSANTDLSIKIRSNIKLQKMLKTEDVDDYDVAIFEVKEDD